MLKYNIFAISYTKFITITFLLSLTALFILPMQVFAMPHSKIVYTSDFSGNWEIYSIDLDGTNQANLSNDSAEDWAPNVSPDGTQITFISRRDGDSDVYIMDIDGSNLTNITDDAFDYYSPHWSPDGTQIAVASDQTGNHEIYTMDIDGSNVTNISNNGATDDAPEWSPDGTKIAFLSDRDGDNEVYVMDSDGSNQINLTNTPANDDGNFGISWTMDGSQIAYTTDNGGGTPGNILVDIQIMDSSDGANKSKFTSATGDEDDVYPFFTKDGNYFIFTSDRAVEGEFEVYISNADGSNPVMITSDSSLGYDPELQPTPYIVTTINNSLITSSVATGLGVGTMGYTVENNETLTVNGTLGNIDIESGGTLMGSGTVGNVSSVSGSTINAGNSPGCLTVADLTAAGTLTFEIDGATVCTEYDQIAVTGTTLDITGATLDIQLDSAYEPAVDDEFTIIDNQTGSAVTGTFTGLAEGDTVDVNGYTFEVSYVGGDGDDVVLTVTAVPATTTTPTATVTPAADSAKAPDTGFGLLGINVLFPLGTTLSSTALLAVAIKRKMLL